VAERGGFELSLYFRTTTFSKLQVLSAEIFSIAPGETPPLSTLLLQAGSRTPHPFFGHSVCNDTLQGMRDIEPGVHFLSKKELPLLRSEKWGTMACSRGKGDSLIAPRIVIFRPNAGYMWMINSRF
jgi:hypothetical protein